MQSRDDPYIIPVFISCIDFYRTAIIIKSKSGFLKEAGLIFL